MKTDAHDGSGHRLTLAPLAPLAVGILIAGCTPAPRPLPPPLVVDPALPAGFPRPLGTEGDTPPLVELGRRLFYDVRLSGDANYACASCHRQELAFTDGRSRALGATGELHPRSAMALVNVAYNATLQWADPDLRTLEEQALRPMLNRRPVEMGVAGREAEVVARLRIDRDYERRFRELFPGEAVGLEHLARALAAFERTLISGGSPFDRRVFRDEPGALNEAARRGMELFFAERTACAECHGSFNFSGPVRFVGEERVEPAFHNTGLYRRRLQDRAGPDLGLYLVSRRRRDVGRFRAPTLRNIAVTAPYMHDGSIATLEEVIDHYAAGGRAGRDHPRKSPLLTGFELGAGERADLVAFLESLTDEGFLTDPRFGDPFAADSRGHGAER